MSQDLTLKIDLRSEVTRADALRVGRRLFHWWTSELAAFLPLAWRLSLSELFRSAQLTVEKDQWIVTSGDDGSLTLDASKAGGELRAELQASMPVALYNCVTVVLPQSEALVRRISVPVSAVHRLRSVVTLQLDRLSPFRGDDVQFDCRIVDGSDSASRSDASVEVAIAPKRKLIQLEQQVRAAGMVPQKFRLADTTMHFSVSGLPWTRQQQSNILRLGVAAGLWILAFFLAPSMQASEIRSLTSEIEGLSPGVQRALETRDTLNRYVLPTQALSDTRSQGLDVLVELNKRLPSDAHLTFMELSDAKLAVEGAGSANFDAVKTLARSPLLIGVKGSGGMGATFRVVATVRRSGG